MIRPFTIEVPEAVIADLRARLERTRWPDAIDDAGWAYGADLAYMRELVVYWRERYDWAADESRLNALPQFLDRIDGVDVHFVHVRGTGPDPLPLIVTHGWPGSFVEMVKIVPRLANPAAHGGDARDAFHVVVPSMPGFGFSSRATGPGMQTQRIGDMWVRLMSDLGYGRFAAQGGDFGASVCTRLGLAHADRLAGIHLNYVPGSYQPPLGDDLAPLSVAERQFQVDRAAWLADEGGYSHLQGTKPQTAAFALTDSPAGLAAWIVEKFRGWADCGGNVERAFTKDELLANIMVYWVTSTIHSSMRLYYEGRKVPYVFGRGERVRVPCAVARFPREIPSPPREWVERGYDVRRWTDMPRGGHFPAMEEPDLLVADIREFFRPLRC